MCNCPMHRKYLIVTNVNITEHRNSPIVPNAKYVSGTMTTTVGSSVNALEVNLNSMLSICS